jgi:hypothetical protein
MFLHNQASHNVAVTLAIVTVTALFSATLAAAQEQDRRAVYQARKFGIGAEYEVQIHHHQPDSTALGWMALPQDLVQPADAFAGEAPWVHVRLEHRILGARTTTDSLLRPTTGKALQRIVRRQRRDHTNFKVTHFDTSGIHVLRLRDSALLTELDWSAATSSYEAYPAWFTDPTLLTDVSALFLLLGNDALQVPGGQLQVPVFTDGRLMQLELQAHDFAAVSTRYVDYATDTGQRTRESRSAVLVSARTRHLDPQASDDGMTILGMTGELQLLVDREWRLPLRISGRAPRLGKIELHLRGIEF